METKYYRKRRRKEEKTRMSGQPLSRSQVKRSLIFPPLPSLSLSFLTSLRLLTEYNGEDGKPGRPELQRELDGECRR